MSYHPDDTICAIATAPGGAARGMVRVSGPDAVGVVAKVFCSADASSIQNFQLPTAIVGDATVAIHGESHHALPCDVFVWPTARSYTREPVAELHTLGSPPLLNALVAAVCGAGARLAEPGEFTLRAFLAGRIDLTQAEAVLGVIDARGNEDLSAALSQLAGGLARPLQILRDDLLQLLAELEAGLDFVEEDIEFISKETLLARLDSATRLLADISQQMSSRSTAMATTQVALVGPPNAGKSSLFNALVARFGCVSMSTEKENKPTPAIVSPQRGTTRDYVTATFDIDGARFELVDTAGIHEDRLPLSLGRRSTAAEEGRGEKSSRPLSNIDVAAQSLAAERRAAASIRVYCIDTTDATALARYSQPVLRESEQCDIVAFTKSDLAVEQPQLSTTPKQIVVVATSSHTGAGLDELCEHIRRLLGTESVAQTGHSVAATAERCGESVRLAESAIARASEIIDHEFGNELAAAELHVALSELGKVVGAVYTDDLLDRIFSTFCIGK